MSADQEAQEHYTRLAQRYFDWLNREYERIDNKINSGVGGACETASTPRKPNCADTSTCTTRTNDEGLA